jgi:hypothetical protein
MNEHSFLHLFLLQRTIAWCSLSILAQPKDTRHRIFPSSSSILRAPWKVLSGPKPLSKMNSFHYRDTLYQDSRLIYIYKSVDWMEHHLETSTLVHGYLRTNVATVLAMRPSVGTARNTPKISPTSTSICSCAAFFAIVALKKGTRNYRQCVLWKENPLSYQVLINSNGDN